MRLLPARHTYAEAAVGTGDDAGGAVDGFDPPVAAFLRAADEAGGGCQERVDEEAGIHFVLFGTMGLLECRGDKARRQGQVAIIAGTLEGRSGPCFLKGRDRSLQKLQPALRTATVTTPSMHERLFLLAQTAHHAQRAVLEGGLSSDFLENCFLRGLICPQSLVDLVMVPRKMPQHRQNVVLV